MLPSRGTWADGRNDRQGSSAVEKVLGVSVDNELI